MNLFTLINEDNKFSLNKPVDTDMVYYSELFEWDTANAFRSLSIKCVLQDTIYYKLNGHEYPVHQGQFMLAVKQPYVKAYFDSDSLVKSICIDICPTSMAQVFTLLTQKSDLDPDGYFSGYFKYPEFYENIYNLDDSLAGRKINTLITSINHGKENVHINREWIYELLEHIVYQEYEHYLGLTNIESVKASTRKEIYKRIQQGKAYMDDHFSNIANIKEVADACFMSEYHFFRSFRQVHRTSPFRYLQQKKLESAMQSLKDSKLPLNTIALSCGFPDVFTFSKAFKRHYHVPPSYIRRQEN